MPLDVNKSNRPEIGRGFAYAALVGSNSSLLRRRSSVVLSSDFRRILPALLMREKNKARMSAKTPSEIPIASPTSPSCMAEEPSWDFADAVGIGVRDVGDGSSELELEMGVLPIGGK